MARIHKVSCDNCEFEGELKYGLLGDRDKLPKNWHHVGGGTDLCPKCYKLLMEQIKG